MLTILKRKEIKQQMSTVTSLSLLMILRVAFLSIVFLVVESTDALLFLQHQKNNNESSSRRNIKATSLPILDATSSTDNDNDTITTTPSRQRRRFLFCQSSSLLGVISSSAAIISATNNPTPAAHAIGEGEERMVFKQKPTAPVSALVPAIQQRLLLEVAIDACKKKDWNKVRMIIPKLNNNDSDDNDDRYKYSLIGPTTSRKMDAKVLKQYDPGLILRGDLTRATMNLYQTNLNYNNILSNSNYNNPNDVITVTDTNWKKSYIRANDGLPDITKIIGADIDIRQLLRNVVQEKLDDASAELYYVLNNNNNTNNTNDDDNVDGDGDDEEILNLLTEAAIQFDKWLDRVRYGDVREAIEIAMQGKRIMIVDSYAAGFMPPPPSQQ